MGIAVEREEKAPIERLLRQGEVQVLTVGIAVDLDRHRVALRFGAKIAPCGL